MQEIFDFIAEYWEILLGALLFVVSTVLAIVRKRPINSIITAIYCAAVQAINVAESTGLKGLEKLKYCVGLVNKSLETSYPGINTGSYYGIIVKVIEEILTTPQKKEDK